MRERLERQRWLGVIALALAVPLPLTGVVSLPFLLPYLAAAAWLVFARSPIPPLPTWAENLLAPVVLVLVVAAGGMRFGILRPVAQLAVAVATIRLPGSGDANRARRTSLLLALVGIAGIASSTHVLLAAYLVTLVALVAAVVGHLSMVAAEKGSTVRLAALWPPARLVAATVTIAVVLATPLFVLLPRLRSPFAASPFGSRPVSGFRDAVALHRIGDVKRSTSIALRVRFEGGDVGDPEWLRLTGATLQRYRNGVWAQAQLRRTLLRGGQGGIVRLAEAPNGGPLRRAAITLEKRSDSLFVPLGAVELTIPVGVPVWRGPLGELRISRGTEVPLTYEVAFAPGAVVTTSPGAEDLRLAEGTEAVAALAREVAGGTQTPVAAALAVEWFLRNKYTYSTSTFAPMRQDPVTWFLFDRGAGHCEFFASSMVLMLRSLGIPARMQAGYAGGEASDDGGYLVRDAEAHAWVIAWIPPTWDEASQLRPALASERAGEVRGTWRMFDPTPADGRPVVGQTRHGFRLRLSWQRVEQLWDRWVLTFSLADQFDIVRDVLLRVRGSLRYIVAGGLAILVLLLAIDRVSALARRLRLTRRRRRHPAGEALERVLHAVRSGGIAVPDNPTPRQLAAHVEHDRPDAAPQVRWLVDRHELSVYAGGQAPTRLEVRRVVRDAVRKLSRRPPAA